MMHLGERRSADIPWLKVSLSIKGRSAEQCKARWEVIQNMHATNTSPGTQFTCFTIALLVQKYKYCSERHAGR
jgi:hypothetical protein